MFDTILLGNIRLVLMIKNCSMNNLTDLCWCELASVSTSTKHIWHWFLIQFLIRSTIKVHCSLCFLAKVASVHTSRKVLDSLHIYCIAVSVCLEHSTCSFSNLSSQFSNLFTILHELIVRYRSICRDEAFMKVLGVIEGEDRPHRKSY